MIDTSTTSTAFDDYPPGIGAELHDRPGLTVAFTNDEFGDIGYLIAGFRPNTNVLAEVRSLDGYDGGVQVTDRFVALEASQTSVVDPTLPLRNHLPQSWRPEDAAELGVRWVLIDPNRDVATQLPGWWPTDLVGGGFEVWENPAWIGDAVGQLADGTEIGFELDRRSPTELVVDVTDPSPMRVIVHSQIAPGWTVRVDGAVGRRHRCRRILSRRRRPGWYPHGGVLLRTEVAHTVARPVRRRDGGHRRARRRRRAPTLQAQGGPVRCRWVD